MMTAAAMTGRSSRYAASPGAAGRPLTDFEQVLLGSSPANRVPGTPTWSTPSITDTGWVTVALITQT
jgi:hypothetical protein